MVKFTLEQIQKIMGKQEQIRNMCVIAHVDHGKSTLSDSLIGKAGIIAQKNVGESRHLDSDKLEQEKGITIKSTAVSMYFELENSGEFLVNLIDSPGHVDFSSEVTAALRVTDGALVVVDAVEGVAVQTETVLRQAMQEMIKPVLMINKIDRQIMELKLDAEEMYLSFAKTIELANAVISGYEFDGEREIEFDPRTGNVAFGAGKDCWAFSLRNFARMYAQKFNVKESQMMKKLWGDNFFDQQTNKWSKSPSPTSKRGFNLFIMEPILKLHRAILSSSPSNSNPSELPDLLSKLSISLPKEDLTTLQSLEPKKLIRSVMSTWLNAADTLLEMIVTHLPSPVSAQQYRYKWLYDGPLDDEAALAIKNCDPAGPLSIYISKMVPTSDKTRFIAFGRIFSGNLKTSQKVRIMGAGFVKGSKKDLFEKNVQKILVMMGRTVEGIGECPCGNVIGIGGIDSVLRKNGTITDCEGGERSAIRTMRFSVSPVVRFAVQPQTPSETPKLVEGLKRLSQADSLVEIIHSETGEFIIACSGELHAAICFEMLQTDFAKIALLKSEPIVTYKETVSCETKEPALAKSSNKLNRMFFHCSPLDSGLTNEIEGGLDLSASKAKELKRRLVEEFAWDKNERLWCFGPEELPSNCLSDVSVGVQYLHEAKDTILSGFQIVTTNGCLAEESLRGVKFSLADAMLHSDNAHRGAGEVIPASRRSMLGAMTMAQPRLQEPIFLCEITTPTGCIGAVYNCLYQRRGEIVEECPVEGAPLTIIKAYLPVSESFGFTAFLRSATSGQAFPQCVFDHWENVKSDPYEENSKAEEIVKTIRKRKGLKPEIPASTYYIDKL